MKHILVISILALISGAAIADSSTKALNSGAAKVAKSKVKSIFDISSFDDKQDRLPPHYNGHSIQLFQETILGNNVIAEGKSEFETKSSYETRKANALNELKFAKMSINSKWAFMFVPRDSAFNYDPEKSQFSYRFTLYPLPRRGITITPSITLEEKRQEMGSYIAQNAMGAKAKVIKEKILIRGLDIKQCQLDNPNFYGSGNGLDWVFGDYMHTIAMSPEQAEKQKSQLRYLFIVNNFNDPYVVEQNEHISPEFPDNLFDTATRSIRTFATIDTIWLYNYETGEIITKVLPCTIHQKELKIETENRKKINFFF